MRVWVQMDLAITAESPATGTASLWLSSMQQDDLQLACKSIVTQSVPSDLLFGLGQTAPQQALQTVAILVPLLWGNLGDMLHVRST